MCEIGPSVSVTACGLTPPCRHSPPGLPRANSGCKWLLSHPSPRVLPGPHLGPLRSVCAAAAGPRLSSPVKPAARLGAESSLGSAPAGPQRPTVTFVVGPPPPSPAGLWSGLQTGRKLGPLPSEGVPSLPPSARPSSPACPYGPRSGASKNRANCKAHRGSITSTN